MVDADVLGVELLDQVVGVVGEPEVVFGDSAVGVFAGDLQLVLVVLVDGAEPFDDEGGVVGDAVDEGDSAVDFEVVCCG